MSPAVSLVLFFSSCVLLAAVFWPRWGVASRVSRYRKLEERVLLEDTLKHLYNCEYAGTPASEESLAGALATPRSVALRLLVRLEKLGFVRMEDLQPTLTREGREYALRVLRSHRLWERYLADRTGIDPADWHDEADRLEHRTSREEMEDLAARLGHPLYDPHGDPIPTAAGVVPPPSGRPLASLEEGEIGKVTHVEDEPPELFRELVSAGIGPGTRIRLLNYSRDSVQFEADGHERTLSPAVASRITVEPMVESPDPVRDSLADLRAGESGRVIGLAPALQGPQRRRLLDLGVVEGTGIEAEFASASGDPVAYRIRGALIALRRSEAENVRIQRFGPGSPNTPLQPVDEPTGAVS
ncbi:MAG: metal-dependent transcriptional regulator [marine benthic group bacterium]|nr:metal-dependent transcriptional regulator [Gemmatimonadota bacterium]